MKISNISIKKIDDKYRLEASILPKNDNKPFVIWFEVERGYKKHLHLGAEPFIAAMLVECMYENEDIYTDYPVSARLMSNLITLMDYLAMGDSDLNRIKVIAPLCKTINVKKQTNVATFFSGGVDSFYTLLKNQEEITHLITVRGFDINLDKQKDKIWEATVDNNKLVARKCRKNIIVVITNARYYIADKENAKWRTKPYKEHWSKSQHGTSLCAVGLALGKRFSKIYIPASFAYDSLVPHGSHPLLDPLWSIEGLEFIHDGCEANRYDKIIRYIADSRVAQSTLRVCWENIDDKYNCGQCEKCLRTIMALEIAGVRKEFKIFPEKYNPSKVLKLDVPPVDFLIKFWAELLEEAKRQNKKKEVVIIERLISKIKSTINDNDIET